MCWIAPGGGDHDDAFAEGELGVDDAAVIGLYLEAHHEAEGTAEPVDRLDRVFVIDRARNSRPAGRGVLHRKSLEQARNA